MITRIEALNYRSLRYIDRRVGPFHVLVGPNASGKSTFLDVVSFLGDFVSEGLEKAVELRTDNSIDLMWKHSGTVIQFAIEAALSDGVRRTLDEPKFDTVRYEVSVGHSKETSGRDFSLLAEKVYLRVAESRKAALHSLFPDPPEPPEVILGGSHRTWRTVVGQNADGNVNLQTETKSPRKSWRPSFRLKHGLSALGNLPPDEEQYPAATWLRSLLTEGVQKFVLNSDAIRKPSPPAHKRGFRTDGSNLPWVINNLAVRHKSKYDDWIRHVRTALPDVEAVKTVQRGEDKHMYLEVVYAGGLRIPSWMVSDGTLRMLGLTLPAYLPDFRGIYLIEEPENGIHPKAVETVFQSLSSVYDAQLMLASHSPVVLRCAEPKQLLCFAKNELGATDIVLGTEHPKLAAWKERTPDLGDLFAAGVLG